MSYLQPKLYDNVFNPDTIEDLKQKYLTWVQTGWRSNRSLEYDHGSMQHSIQAPSTRIPVDLSILPHMRTNHPSLCYVWDKIKEVLVSDIGDRGLYRVYAKQYHYGMDAYKHTDGQAKKFVNENKESMTGEGFETIILYLNTEWKTDYYGQTVLYTDDDEIDMSVLPKYNRMFIFDSAQSHASTPLSRMCPIEKQVLVFNSFPKKACAPSVEYLVEHTKDIRHSQGRSFTEHLWSTYNLLVGYKVPNYVALAGLWHAVYDTVYFKNPNKAMFPSDLVKDFIGVEAEDLVARYCGLPKPRVDAIVQLRDINLAFIEFANLWDQNPDGRQNEKLSKLTLLIDDLKNE